MQAYFGRAKVRTVATAILWRRKIRESKNSNPKGRCEGERRKEGRGRGEKNLLSPRPPPLLLTRPIFSILLELQHGSVASKTFVRQKKTPALQANDKLVAIQSNLHNIKIQKHQKFTSQSLTVGTSSKRAPPVSDRDHFLGLTVNDFPLFLTSCKRPLDTFSNLYVRCVHYAT